MTRSVGVHEAKTQLSKLIELVRGGEEVVITRRGEAVALLVRAPAPTRHFGLDRGRLVVPDDFDAPMGDDELSAFGA